jgi:hypothetical protein
MRHRSTHTGGMTRGNSLFVNLSQKEYGEQKWRGRQLSVVQSHTASLRYAQQSQRILAIPAAASDEATVVARPPNGRATCRRRRKPANVSTVSRKQTLPPHSSLQDSSAQELPAVPELSEQEDLAFNDLTEVFQLNTNSDISGGKDAKVYAITNKSSGYPGSCTDVDSSMQARRSPQYAPTTSLTSTKRLINVKKRRKSTSRAASPGVPGNNYRARPIDMVARKSPGNVPAIQEITSSLDPFIRLPLEMSGPDKSLLHFCELNGGMRFVGSPMQISIMADAGYGEPLRPRDTAQHCTPSIH